MLVKCVCGNCGHSFLTDDQTSDLTCARCGFVNDGSPVGGFSVPAPPPPAFGHEPEEYDHHRPEPAYSRSAHFDPKAPPPVFASWGRMLRGMLFGGIFAAGTGVALGGAFAATAIVIPGIAALVMAFVAGAATRHGLGGRAAHRTRGFALVAVLFAVPIGYSGILAGSWAVERFTGTRASQTRKDLDAGKKYLTTGLARAQQADDVAERTILQTRLRRTERLESYTDAQLEDYLWTQQAQINQPLVAYAKLRVTQAPLVRLGPDRDPIEAPTKHMPAAIAGVELLLAMILAYQGVRQRR